MSVTFSVENDDQLDMNLANTNARAFLAALGLPSDDLCGALTPQDWPKVRAKLIWLKNSDRRQAQFARETVQLTPNWTECGLPPERLVMYAERFEELLERATELNRPIYWW